MDSELSLTSQTEGLLALMPAMLTPFFTLALWGQEARRAESALGAPGTAGSGDSVTSLAQDALWV